MKLFRELLIILSVYFLGEFLSKALKLPIPGNILGMLILLTLLLTNIVKVNQVEKVSNFFLDHLSFFFIPAGVGLITSVAVIKDSWYKLLVVCVLTTIIVIISTGTIVQYLSNKKTKGSEESE